MKFAIAISAILLLVTMFFLACRTVVRVKYQHAPSEENSLRTALLYIANSTCPDRPRDARRMQAEIPPHVNELWGIWKEIGAFQHT